MAVDIVDNGAGGYTVIPVSNGVGFNDGDVVVFVDPNDVLTGSSNVLKKEMIG